MTEPKQGDRVRLAPKDGGETVIVGTINDVSSTAYSVFVTGRYRNAFLVDEWNIEVIEPTTLDKVKALKAGAVIHNGRMGTALAVKMHGTGDWCFIYSDGDTPGAVAEESLAQFIDGGSWEIKYEGHEVI